MPKVPKSFTSFGRRVFSMRIEFDGDNDGPHEITFPVRASSRETSPVLDWDSDEDHTHITDLTGNSASSRNVQEGPGEASGSAEDDDIEESPYDRLRDKRFYKKPTSFYYYLFCKASHLDQPPPHPAVLEIRLDTLFIHRNPDTSQVRTWIWGKKNSQAAAPGLAAANAEDSENVSAWIPLNEREERRFDHGTYHYVVSSTGTPSWVVYETLWKNKYRNGSTLKGQRGGGHGGPSEGGGQ
ncbi:hypothetical protein H1R20_g10760, partial [Candolleomyces eurysporus]